MVWCEKSYLKIQEFHIVVHSQPPISCQIPSQSLHFSGLRFPVCELGGQIGQSLRSLLSLRFYDPKQIPETMRYCNSQTLEQKQQQDKNFSYLTPQGRCNQLWIFNVYISIQSYLGILSLFKNLFCFSLTTENCVTH